MYYKILLAQILFLGAVICTPHSRNDTLYTGSLTNEIENEANLTVNEISEIPLNTTTLKDKVQLTVYYETHCRYSVSFFIYQLKPAISKLGSHLDLKLVPYGNAETNDDGGHYSFSCQHGEVECRGNMVHACVINSLHNETSAALFNICLMRYAMDYSNTDILLCALIQKISLRSVDNIKSCVNGTLGSTLLKTYGDMTSANGVSYVPYLTLDESTEREDDAREDLTATVCEMLNPKPVQCSSS